MLSTRRVATGGCLRVALAVAGLGLGGCACEHGQGHAAADAGEVIDKQAELAELALMQCKAHDDAKCDDVAAKLKQIRSAAVDLKGLDKK
ncbi:MAG TPA: hypothetical protein VFV94_15760 [Polyangiaceae bacterium]|nr:hypothetical protein [Polyangiaceae bacterium]